MNAKRLHIALILMLGMIFLAKGVVFAEQPKGSRLYVKPVAKKKTLSFTKGKSVLAFKPNMASFDLKSGKTVNLYFANYLINRNLSKSIFREQELKTSAVPEITVSQNQNKAVEKDEEAAEQGERLIAIDGLNISNIYPNPADDAGHFDYSFTGNNYKDVKIDFFNVLGTPMNVSVEIEKFERKVKINLKDFPNGFYFYQLIADGKTLATKKLLVRHYN